MKTAHRIMSEALSKDHYERWCHNTTADDISNIYKHSDNIPGNILGWSFDWFESNEGYEYWQEIRDSLNVGTYKRA